MKTLITPPGAQLQVTPRYADWEQGAWKAYCRLCEAHIGKAYSTRWHARHAAAGHLNGHRRGTIDVAAMRRYGENERLRLAREVEVVKARREGRPPPPPIGKVHLPGETPLSVEGKCRTPGKKQHWSREEGEAHIQSLDRAGRGNPDYKVYACPCGWYHVGHSSDKFQKRIKKSLNIKRR